MVERDSGTKEAEGPISTVLRLNLHCQGCAKKLRRYINHFEGVKEIYTDCATNTLTVIGDLDPVSLCKRVENKTKKTVELLSPQPREVNGTGGRDKKAEENKKTDEQKTDDKKLNEVHPVYGTVVMKMKLHCDGCAHKIERIILKNIAGVNSVSTDLQKDLVTLTGAMDVKELKTNLQDKFRRVVEIVTPKNANTSREAGVGDKRGKEGGGGGGEKKVSETNSGKVGGEKTGGVKMEVKNMEFRRDNPQTLFAMPPVYSQSFGYQDYGGVQMFANQGHTEYMVNWPGQPLPYLWVNEHIFSDENPNGCFVM